MKSKSLTDTEEGTKSPSTTTIINFQPTYVSIINQPPNPCSQIKVWSLVIGIATLLATLATLL
jgi:hypothetical protein